METLFNMFCCIFRKKNKINPNNNNIPVTIKNCKIYYELQKNIHKCQPLSKNELDYIKTLPRENLIDIVNIYNIHISNFELLNKFRPEII